MPQDAVLHRQLVPEEFTHLYHTSCYAQLSDSQRLQYNQLYGLRINEQFIQFEELFIKGLMPRLKRNNALREHPALMAAISAILRDEERHSRMFAQYNRSLRPDLYKLTPAPFTRLSALERSLLKLLLSTPGLLPGLIWLLLAMEELTTAISQALISHSESTKLDSDYIELHRQHLLDERRHVGIDKKLLLRLQERTPAFVDKINAWLFRNIFRNVLKPRRSTIQVIRQFTREEPDLETMAENMIREIQTLDPHVAFPANLIKTDTLPVLYSLFDRYPEYRLPPLNVSA